MKICIQAMASLLTAAAVLATTLSASGEAPASRASRRRQAEAQIVALEARLTDALPDGDTAAIALATARQQVALARKLLTRGNHRAAKAMADQAEALLKRTTPAEQPQ